MTEATGLSEKVPWDPLPSRLSFKQPWPWFRVDPYFCCPEVAADRSPKVYLNVASFTSGKVPEIPHSRQKFLNVVRVVGDIMTPPGYLHIP